MTEKKEAQGSPAQPGGWAVTPVETYTPGELQALEEQKRRDTAEWEDSQNRSPMDNENPAQPGGFAVPPATNAPIRSAASEPKPRKDGYCANCQKNASAPGSALCAGCKPKTSSADIVAKVFASKTAGREEGSKVLLGTSQDDYSLGEVIAVTDEKFWVQWRDGEDSIEKKADYQLIVRDDEADEE